MTRPMDNDLHIHVATARRQGLYKGADHLLLQSVWILRESMGYNHQDVASAIASRAELVMKQVRSHV